MFLHAWINKSKTKQLFGESWNLPLRSLCPTIAKKKQSIANRCTFCLTKGNCNKNTFPLELLENIRKELGSKRQIWPCRFVYKWKWLRRLIFVATGVKNVLWWISVFGSRGGATEIHVLTMISVPKCQFLAISEDWTNVYTCCLFKLIINNEWLVYIHSLDFALIIYVTKITQFWHGTGPISPFVVLALSTDVSL